MRLLLLLTFPLYSLSIPIVWELPPLRNVSMPPVQLILDEGQGLFSPDKVDYETSPAATSTDLEVTSDELLFDDDKASTGGFPFDFNFPPAPIYCISFLCIGNLLGFNSSTATEPTYEISTEVEISTTTTPVLHASADTKSESDITDDSSERIARAALLFFGSLPGVALLCFMTLGKFLLPICVELLLGLASRM